MWEKKHFYIHSNGPGIVGGHLLSGVGDFSVVGIGGDLKRDI